MVPMMRQHRICAGPEAITAKDSQDVWPHQLSQRQVSLGGRLLQTQDCGAGRCCTLEKHRSRA